MVEGRACFLCTVCGFLVWFREVARISFFRLSLCSYFGVRVFGVSFGLVIVS